MTTTDPYNLQRFLGAQESFYAQALKEIRKVVKPRIGFGSSSHKYVALAIV